MATSALSSPRLSPGSVAGVARRVIRRHSRAGEQHRAGFTDRDRRALALISSNTAEPACCWAVMVLPQAFARSISTTAPAARIWSRSSPSTMQGRQGAGWAASLMRVLRPVQRRFCGLMNACFVDWGMQLLRAA